jgi:hypothetical protein
MEGSGHNDGNISMTFIRFKTLEFQNFVHVWEAVYLLAYITSPAAQC